MPNINLHLGDSLEAMRQMPDNHYTIAIVDPPYGIANMETFRPPAGNKPVAVEMQKRILVQQLDKMRGWDIAPDAEYFDQLMRVSQNQIIWGGNYFPSIWQHGGRCVIAWDKCQPWPNFSQIELAWTSYNKPAKLFKFDNRTKGKIHPTQKPIALYLWLLDTFAKPGDTILDTHLGSGSIACACYDAGYDLDAWEIDPEYHAAATARYKEHSRQTKLFY